MKDTTWIERAGKADYTVLNVVGGKRSAPAGPTLIEKFAARDGEKIAQFAEGTADDVDKAVATAKAAFDDGRWSRKSVHTRASILFTLADLVEDAREELALLESQDTGKPISHALGDIATVASTIRSAAKNAPLINGPSTMDGDSFCHQLRKPVGVCAAIVGWNYPLVLASQKVGPALAMGNTLVLKPSEYTSLSTWRLAELALEAGVPEGVFNVINGAGATVGNTLAHHMDIRLLSFTGSSATGRLLMKASGASNMKRLILECGGKSPFLVFDDYEGSLEALARKIIVDTTFRNQGALCVSSSRIFLQAGIREKLLPELI